MSEFDKIFIQISQSPDGEICKVGIDSVRLKAWCEAMEYGTKTNAKHIGNALMLINKLSDIIEQLGDSVKVLSDRVVELQTVCKYLDDKVQKLESMKGDNNNA